MRHGGVSEAWRAGPRGEAHVRESGSGARGGGGSRGMGARSVS
jgi:hypothetical protein